MPEGASKIAEKWLRELLANGPVPAATVEAEAHKAGIGFTVLKAVKKRIGVESQRVSRDGAVIWEWVIVKDLLQLEPTL